MNFNSCFSRRLKLAQAYIPFQEMGKVYSLGDGLFYGTIFPELNMPYELENKKGCFCRINSNQEEFQE